MKRRFAPYRFLSRVAPLTILLIGDAVFRLAAAAPVVRTIPGEPLVINIGDETSMQIADARVPDTANFQPLGCFGPGTTGDAGVLVSVGGVVFGPDFQNHACATAANAYTPWTPVSISPVSGSGAAGDPFVVVVVADAGNSGLRLTETVSYTNGSETAAFSFRFQNRGSAAVSWSTFLAADLTLLYGLVTPSLRSDSSPQGQSEFKPGAPIDCIGVGYYVFFPAGDRYTGNQGPTMWNEITSGELSDTLGPECRSTGIAVQWTSGPLPAGASTTVGPLAGAGLSFGGIAPAQPIPGLGPWGALALASVLGFVGAAILNRR